MKGYPDVKMSQWLSADTSHWLQNLWNERQNNLSPSKIHNNVLPIENMFYQVLLLCVAFLHFSTKKQKHFGPLISRIVHNIKMKAKIVHVYLTFIVLWCCFPIDAIMLCWVFLFNMAMDMKTDDQNISGVSFKRKTRIMYSVIQFLSQLPKKWPSYSLIKYECLPSLLVTKLMTFRQLCCVYYRRSPIKHIKA